MAIVPPLRHPRHIRPHLCAGHRCLRIRHRRLPNRARRPAWLHLAGLRRPHVRLHDRFQQVRSRYIRNMVQSPGARRQARRHGRRRPLDGRPGHSRHEHLFRRLCDARRIRQSATHRAVRGARRLGGPSRGLPQGRTSRRTATCGRHHRAGHETHRARCGWPGSAWRAGRHGRLLRADTSDHAARLPKPAFHLRTVVGGTACPGGCDRRSHAACLGLRAGRPTPRGLHPAWRDATYRTTHAVRMARTDFPCRVGRRLPAAQQHLRIRALGSDGGLRHHLRRLLPRLRHGERCRYLGGGDARQIACETPEGRGHYDCHAPYPRQSQACLAQRVRRGARCVHRGDDVGVRIARHRNRRQPRPVRPIYAVHARYSDGWFPDARLCRGARRRQFRRDADEQRLRPGRRVPHACVGRHG
ncbi:unknown [Bifidobacterium pseudocatenulatum CAG:263]|nr:unknown [Bifidobacterium pseudocatenulatum CAG:263]